MEINSAFVFHFIQFDGTNRSILAFANDAGMFEEKKNELHTEKKSNNDCKTNKKTHH